MAALVGTPVTFARSGRTAPNVFLKSAMTERLCTWSDENPDERGKPTPEYVRLYEEWGKGEIGVIVLGNIPCDRRYPEAKGNAMMDPLSPWDAVKAFTPVIQGAKAKGSLVIGQVTHAGRQTPSEVTTEPVSSSDVASGPLGGMTFHKPRPLTVDEIKDVVQRFAFAAKTLYDAGADGIQLHSAHGYLLSQFLSPRVNTRTDHYGGANLDNRSRIVFEIIDAIKERVTDPSFILSIKINSADFSEGGFDEEESREMAKRLEASGVDLIELSGGTYESGMFYHRKQSTRKREAFFIEFAERTRPHLTKAKLCVTGGFRTLDGMTRALNERSTDMIGIARPLTSEPFLCADLISGKSTAAKANLVGEAMQTGASILQLPVIAKGHTPQDLSDPKVAEEIMARLRGSRQGVDRQEEGDLKAQKDSSSYGQSKM